MYFKTYWEFGKKAAEKSLRKSYEHTVTGMELFQFHLLVMCFGSLPVTFSVKLFYTFLTDSKSASGLRFFNIYI
jgi:hypothetical protein